MPVISQNFQVLPNGISYTAQGAFSAVIAHLDTGCGFQGTGCAIVETSLINGVVSSTDISLIPDHRFNVPVSFVYTGGCAASVLRVNRRTALPPPRSMLRTTMRLNASAVLTIPVSSSRSAEVQGRSKYTITMHQYKQCNQYQAISLS